MNLCGDTTIRPIYKSSIGAGRFLFLTSILGAISHIVWLLSLGSFSRGQIPRLREFALLGDAEPDRLLTLTISFALFLIYASVVYMIIAATRSPAPASFRHIIFAVILPLIPIIGPVIIVRAWHATLRLPTILSTITATVWVINSLGIQTLERVPIQGAAAGQETQSSRLYNSALGLLVSLCLLAISLLVLHHGRSGCADNVGSPGVSVVRVGDVA